MTCHICDFNLILTQTHISVIIMLYVRDLRTLRERKSFCFKYHVFLLHFLIVIVLIFHFHFDRHYD